MKKLLHIVLYLPFGGLEKIVYDFSVALNGKGYEVHVAALQEGGPMQSLLEDADIPVYVLGKRPGKIDFNLLYRLIKLIHQLKIDIIHSHSGCIMYAALAGRIAGVTKIIHTDHGRYFPEPKLRIFEDRIFSKFISKYVCVSRELEKYIKATVKVTPKKIITIINGVDTSSYYQYPGEVRAKLRKDNNIPVDSIVVGTVCRLIPPKNVQFLVEWMEKYHKFLKNIYLIIVGDGPQLEKLKKQADAILGQRVIFLGAKKNIADILNTFDIFTLVSTTEGTSLTILESMSTQLPVIVSDVGGNTDIIIHGKNGFLFKCNDFKSFNDCIKIILRNPFKSKEIGRLARNSIETKFSLNKVIEKYCDIYK
ncbi:MAG: glycosyltransferase [Desulfobulbaceae bacterium]|nr:glycosyltransferase [Desulfobulbaceae bacterium]